MTRLSIEIKQLRGTEFLARIGWNESRALIRLPIEKIRGLSMPLISRRLGVFLNLKLWYHSNNRSNLSVRLVAVGRQFFAEKNKSGVNE